MLPGTAREGWMTDTFDDGDQLMRWFRVEAGRHETLVGQGRWTTLAIERPFVRAAILVQGPGDGEPVKVRSIQGSGPHRLFVADGTRAVLVHLEPGGELTFDAALREFVVR